MAASDKKLQGFTAFNSGEYSRDLAGRTDLESFGSSTRYSCNFLTQVSGGLKKFYGTRHIAEKSVDNYNIKLIPFITKYEPMAFVVYGTDSDEATGLAVGLIHGDNYKDLTIQLPKISDLQNIRWQQINDRLVLCHPEMAPMAINFYGLDSDGEYVFSVGNIDFKEVPYFPIGVTDYVGTLQASGLTGEVTISLPSGSANVYAYMPAIIAAQSEYTRSGSQNTLKGTIHINNSTFKIYRIRSGVTTTLVSGVVNSGSVQTVTTGSTTKYKYTDKITQTKILNVVRTVYPQAYINGPEIVLLGIADHQDGDEYYTEVSVGRIYNNSTIHAAATYTSEHYTPVPETIDNTGLDGLVGRKIKFFFNDDTEISPWWQNKSVTTGDYAYSNGHWYKAMSTGTCGNVQPSHTKGAWSDGGVVWQYVHSGSKTASVLSVDTTLNTMSILVENGELPKNPSNLYKNYSVSIWGKDNIYPSEVYMVGNRLGFVCNTKSLGSWNAMSITDDYFNFDTEEFGEQLDTSAIVGLVGNNESSDINWVLARSRLYMGGYSGEYFVNPGGTNRRSGVYTPTTSVVENISNMGGKSVIPLKYKELNMFVGVTGKELYTIAYDYTTDDYTPRMMGYLTQHIMERGIRRIEALNNLDRNIYLLHDTNQLSLFNYAAEQKVMGFTELDFVDEVVDFVTTYARDDIAAYVATKRNTGKITFERLATVNPTYMFDEIVQGNGTVADFAPVPHFANRTVYVRYGNELSQFVKVTLDENGDVSHDATSGVYMPQSEYFKIGIPMVSELHTQPAFGNKVEGHQQQSLSVYIRLDKSGAFEYGSSVDFSRYFKYEAWNLQQEYDVAHRLYTGDIKLDIPLGYAEAQNQGEGLYPNTSGVGINIKSDTPEPLHILSMQEIYI